MREMTGIKHVNAPRPARLLRRTALAAVMLLAWQVSHRTLAEATINFSGTLVSAPSCIVNGNNTVDVDFGDDIITRQVDGLNFKTRINYAIVCASMASKGMKVAISGTPAAFGSGLISAGKTGLAIQLWNGTDRLANAAPVSFTWPKLPELYATPVAQDSTILTAGTFSSTASLVLSYQ